MSENIALQCLGGGYAPAAIVAGWRAFARTTPATQRDLWELVEPGVVAVPPPDQDERGHAFCAKHQMTPGDGIAMTQAVSFLVAQAAAVDLSVDMLRQDLAGISEGEPRSADYIASRYAATRPELRAKLLNLSLSDHGKVLRGLHWRIERIESSDRGVNLGAGIVRLTLQYLEGDRPDQISFQLPPDAIEELRAFVSRFGPPGGQGPV